MSKTGTPSIMTQGTSLAEPSGAHSARGGWTVCHPDNWTSDHVQDWLQFTMDKFTFPMDLRTYLVERVTGMSGSHLMALGSSDFRFRFGEAGELINIMLRQILDLAPGHEGLHVFLILNVIKNVISFF